MWSGFLPSLPQAIQIGSWCPPPCSTNQALVTFFLMALMAVCHRFTSSCPKCAATGTPSSSDPNNGKHETWQPMMTDRLMNRAKKMKVISEVSRTLWERKYVLPFLTFSGVVCRQKHTISVTQCIFSTCLRKIIRCERVLGKEYVMQKHGSTIQSGHDNVKVVRLWQLKSEFISVLSCAGKCF